MLGIFESSIQNETKWLQQLSSILAFYYPRHENIIIIRDFRKTPETHHLRDFMQIFALSCLINKPTCHHSKFAICILKNKKNLFKFSHNFATGISCHHALSSTIIKFEHVNGPPKRNLYRSYENFNLDTLMNSIWKKVAQKQILG